MLSVTWIVFRHLSATEMNSYLNMGVFLDVEHGPKARPGLQQESCRLQIHTVKSTPSVFTGLHVAHPQTDHSRPPGGLVAMQQSQT